MLKQLVLRLTDLWQILGFLGLSVLDYV
jgi:hypothetical protein